MANRASARRPHSGVESSPGVSEELQESRLWYLVAATPLFAVAAVALFLLTVPLMALLGSGPASGLFYLTTTVLGVAGLVVFALLPVGLYTDAELVAEVGEWAPDRDRYVRRAGWGVTAYVIGFLVGAAAWDTTTAIVLALVFGSALALSAAVPYLQERRERVGLY